MIGCGFYLQDLVRSAMIARIDKSVRPCVFSRSYSGSLHYSLRFRRRRHNIGAHGFLYKAKLSSGQGRVVGPGSFCTQRRIPPFTCPARHRCPGSMIHFLACALAFACLIFSSVHRTYFLLLAHRFACDWQAPASFAIAWDEFHPLV